MNGQHQQQQGRYDPQKVARAAEEFGLETEDLLEMVSMHGPGALGALEFLADRTQEPAPPQQQQQPPPPQQPEQPPQGRRRGQRQ